MSEADVGDEGDVGKPVPMGGTDEEDKFNHDLHITMFAVLLTITVLLFFFRWFVKNQGRNSCGGSAKNRQKQNPFQKCKSKKQQECDRHSRNLQLKVLQMLSNTEPCEQRVDHEDPVKSSDISIEVKHSSNH